MAAQVSVIAVGRAARLLEPAIDEYEERAGRYWRMESRWVKAEPASRNRPVEDVRRAEAERLRAAAAPEAELVALTRAGRAWTSRRLATYLSGVAMQGGQAAFLIGGAYGLDQALVEAARHRLSLSPMTLPHDLARLVLAEQLYRAGTIVRGEPYHKT